MSNLVSLFSDDKGNFSFMRVSSAFAIVFAAGLSLYSLKLGTIEAHLPLIMTWLGAGYSGKAIQKFAEKKEDQPKE